MTPQEEMAELLERIGFAAEARTVVSEAGELSNTKSARYLRNKRRKRSEKRARIDEAKARSSKKRRDFYASDAWTTLRYEALRLHGATCQCCGASRKTGAVIHVDHIKPRSKYPHLSLDITNLQVLCEPCNLGKRARDQTDWR